MEGQDSILLKVLAKDRLYFALKEIESMLIEMNSIEPTKSAFLWIRILRSHGSPPASASITQLRLGPIITKENRLQKSVDIKV